jgi:hypothetical protein
LLGALAGWTAAAAQRDEPVAPDVFGPAHFQEECFLLERVVPEQLVQDAWASPSARHGEVVGLAVLRRREDERVRQREWDVRLAADGLRLVHVEQDDGARQSLTWREIGVRGGRTFIAQRRAGGDWQGKEWEVGQRVDLQWPDEREVFLPLEAIERVRCGVLAPSLAVLDPLSRSVETWYVRPRAEALELPPAPQPEGAPSADGWIEFERADGTSAGAWRFDGGALTAFRWQRGGLVARRVDSEEFRRRWAELEPVFAAH